MNANLAEMERLWAWRFEMANALRERRDELLDVLLSARENLAAAPETPGPWDDPQAAALLVSNTWPRKIEWLEVTAQFVLNVEEELILPAFRRHLARTEALYARRAA